MFLSALFIFALTFAGYANTLTSPFLDGDEYIHLFDARNMLENFSPRDYFDFLVFLKNGDAEQLVRPLLTFPFVIGYGLFGTNVVGFHIMHVAFHALAGIALFLSVYYLAGRTGPGIIAGGAFALHPVLSRPIAWTAALTHSPPTLFFFLSLLFFILYRRRNHNRWFLFLCGICLLIDIGLWELGAVLPLLFFCVDVLFFPKEAFQNGRSKWLAPYAILFGLVALYVANIFLRIALFDLEEGRQYFANRLSENSPGLVEIFRAMLDGLLRPFHQGIFNAGSLPWLFLASVGGAAILIAVSVFQKDWDPRLIVLGLAILLLTYLPAKGSAQLDYEYLMRSRLLIGPAAGLGIMLGAFLGTSKILRITGIALVFAMAVVVSINNQAFNRIGIIQTRVNNALEALLSNYPLNRPTVFICNNPDTPQFSEPEDFIETAFAARRFYHPDFDALWIQPAKLALKGVPLITDSNVRPLGIPIFIEIRGGFAQFSDATARYEKMADLIMSIELDSGDPMPSYTPDISPAYPSAAKPATRLMIQNENRAVVLDGDLYFITKDRMLLASVSYEKWLETFEFE